MNSSVYAFSVCLEKFFAGRNSSNNDSHLYIFQGFPLSFYKALKIPHLSGNWDGLLPDIELLDGFDLLPSLVTLKGTAWCFYEEFEALSSVLTTFRVVKGSMIVVKNDLFSSYYPLPENIPQEKFINAFNKSGSYLHNYYTDCKTKDGFFLLSYMNRHTQHNIPEVGFFEETAKFSEYRSVSGMPEENSALPVIELKIKLLAGELSNTCFVLRKAGSDSLTEEIRRMNMLGSFYGVSFKVSKSTTEKSADSTGSEYLPLLRKYWGEDASFREQVFYSNPAANSKTMTLSQGSIIADIIAQSRNAASGLDYSDIIVTAPTGSGKSIFFQIPAIYLHEKRKNPELTIVVCPLVALMADQVGELNRRGVKYATFINNTVTWEERAKRIEGIRNGKYSVVYLSPEFLLAGDINSLTGGRKIGLFVVDEAHLVTSWGRDFRADYWFMGDYIENVRKGTYHSSKAPQKFPVLCLTATAVYGGRDDVIGDLQESLHLMCYSGHIYTGYVKRSNIAFDIRHPGKFAKSDKQAKSILALNAAVDYVRAGQKTIIYFPFTSQADETERLLRSNYPQESSRIEKYHGSMKSADRTQAYENFRSSRSMVMLATKAFGMGVNIGNIANIYHFSPTGSLSDYVQEIGRAARSLKWGHAVSDYMPSDMRYVQTLWGLSGLRHYQIKAMAKRLYRMYTDNHCKSNLLFSPESFGYLFGTDTDNKVKNGLLLLSNDLLNTYHFRVMNIKPRSLFSVQYIIVPPDIERAFLDEYGAYCTKVRDNFPQKIFGTGNCSGQVIEVAEKIGNIFEIDLAALWENKFSDLSFQQFKYKFMSGELFSGNAKLSCSEFRIVPNMKMTITYSNGYDEIKGRFAALASAVQDAFIVIKQRFGRGHFSLNDFAEAFRGKYSGKIMREYVRLLLDLFCYDHVDFGYGERIPSEAWKFVERIKLGENDDVLEEKYCMRMNKYASISAMLQRYFAQSAPNYIRDGTEKYVAYLAIPGRDMPIPFQQLMASMLQLFDFASYEVAGGRKLQISVRINDPSKLLQIAEDEHYSNGVLKAIEERHKRSVMIMGRFMSANLSSAKRWEIIEEYFLGHDDKVDRLLGIR